MPDTISFRNTFHALESAIAITQQRHTHISSNISNIDTSDYRAKDIDFKTAMARALESEQKITLSRTDPGHINMSMASGHYIEPFEERGEWNGYNWVNIDREMLKLIENNLMHKTAVEILLRKIAILRQVIREGGR